MTHATDPTPERRPSPPEMLAPGVLVPAFVLMIVVAYALFARGIGTVAGNELGKHRSFMVAVNAATLTGFQTARNPGEYTAAGQVISLALIIGGTLFSLVGGGLAVVRIARLPFRDRTIGIAAIVAIVIVATIGAFAGSGPDGTAFDGVYDALSAFGNVGLFVGPRPIGNAPRTLLLLLPLAVLGSLGLPLLLDLIDRPRGGGRRISAHTWRVLTASAATYLLTVAVLLPLFACQGSPKGGQSLLTWAASTASREAVNARSAGFPFQFVTSLPTASVVVIWVAMIIGGAPAGTAGGVKVTTLAVVARGLRDGLRGRPLARPFAIAVGWVAIYLGLLATATIGLLLADPELPADRIVFLAASALGNVGLSHDPVSPSTAGMYVLSVTMLVGRVLPVVVLWVIADRMPDVTDAIG